jgi:hypothetical protein
MIVGSVQPLFIARREGCARWATHGWLVSKRDGNTPRSNSRARLRYERNQSEPPIEVLLAYARAVGARLEQIVDDDVDLTLLGLQNVAAKEDEGD